MIQGTALFFKSLHNAAKLYGVLPANSFNNMLLEWQLLLLVLI